MIDRDGEMVLLLGQKTRTKVCLEAEPKGRRFLGRVAGLGDVIGLLHAYSLREGFVNIIDRLSSNKAGVKDRAANLMAMKEREVKTDCKRRKIDDCDFCCYYLNFERSKKGRVRWESEGRFSISFTVREE